VPRFGELSQLGSDPGDVIAQRFLAGPLFDACAVAKDGRVAGLVTQERRLMYPISGGVGSALATVDDPALSERATSLLEALGWTGPVQLEFKWDPTTRGYALIELNPRFWGTTGAWLEAGANFPALAVDLARGRTPAGFPKLPRGLRFKASLGRYGLSLVQLWRAKGIGALRDPVSYDRTWSELDLGDPLPELWRLYNDAKAVLRGRRALVDRSLPAELLPSYGAPAAEVERSP